MHKIGKALLLLCSLTSAGEIAAQTVSGKLIDENKQPTRPSSREPHRTTKETLS